VEQKKIEAVLTKTFLFERANEALDTLKSREYLGKIGATL